VCPTKVDISSEGQGSPSRVKARSPVAWMASWRETKSLEPIDKAVFRAVSESSGRNGNERIGGLKNLLPPKAEPEPQGLRQNGTD